jgi:hypothetical protein
MVGINVGKFEYYVFVLKVSHVAVAAAVVDVVAVPHLTTGEQILKKHLVTIENFSTLRFSLF